MDRPKAAPFVGSFYDSAEVQKLFEAAKGSKLEIPIFLGAFYGLRRSEAIGLKWDAIDFQNDTITIRHTVVSCYIDGKQVQKAQDITKTKSSMRTLPLIPAFKELLQHKKQQQNEFQRMCNKSYNKDYPGYICVDEMGRLLSPHYLTEAFAKLLKKHGLRKIRYHDLRHSCASLLLANGVPMKQIQEWLGHNHRQCLCASGMQFQTALGSGYGKRFTGGFERDFLMRQIKNQSKANFALTGGDGGI